jgi:hypothetical protein
VDDEAALRLRLIFVGRFAGLGGHFTVKKVERLTALAVEKAKALGLYPDSARLYLRVGRGGAKSWAFRFMLIVRCARWCSAVSQR